MKRRKLFKQRLSLQCVIEMLGVEVATICSHVMGCAHFGMITTGQLRRLSWRAIVPAGHCLSIIFDALSVLRITLHALYKQLGSIKEYLLNNFYTK